jgi:sulfate/thiosulfate transport system substrate-binding protein
MNARPVRAALAALSLACASLLPASGRAAAPSGPVELTLVSYAVAKPLFAKLIPEFQRTWKEQTGQEVRFKESYGPSGAQARSIVGGLDADVFASNLQTLMDPLVAAGLVKPGWEKRLPSGASPASSVIAIIVRQGNPKKLQSWQDLAAPGVEIVAINPKTSGNARWGVVAGYGSVLREKDANAAEGWVGALVRNTKTLASGGREATDAFVKNGVGDALLTFENEALFAAKASGEPIEWVVPAANVRTDFPVVVVDQVVDRKGTRAVAEAFAKFLFTPKAQALYAEAGYRPSDAAAAKAAAGRFREVPGLFSIDDLGGWKKIDQALFADGAAYDRAQAARGGR